MDGLQQLILFYLLYENKMIEILLQGILACVMIPDYDEFSMCIDNVVLEYNMSLEWKDQS